jgi:hypothetical protein
MDVGAFDEEGFFASIMASAARALLIGRRAMIALGLPVLTGDYDFWIHIDDIVAFNDAVAPFDLYPGHTPDQARQQGRYVLENDEKVDVLVARVVPTVDGVRVAFDDIWPRRQRLTLCPGVEIIVPALDDLIATKRFGARPRDVDDIRLLEQLKGADDP